MVNNEREVQCDQRYRSRDLTQHPRCPWTARHQGAVDTAARY